MKQLIVGLISVVSIALHANTLESVFNKNSSLPRASQTLVLNAVSVQCADVVNNYGLTEVQTTLREQHVDQGTTDTYYTTTLNAEYYFDNMHPTNTTITVESVNYGPYEDLQIIRIEAPAGCTK